MGATPRPPDGSGAGRFSWVALYDRTAGHFTMQPSTVHDAERHVRGVARLEPLRPVVELSAVASAAWRRCPFRVLPTLLASPMTRTSIAALLLLLLTAPLASAQSVAGGWTYTFSASAESPPFERGPLLLPANDGEGRIVLETNGIDSGMTDVRISRDGASFTAAGQLTSFNAAFTLEATFDGSDAFTGTFSFGRQRYTIRAERADDAIATYEARQDSLRRANAPEPVDMFEPFDLPSPSTLRTGSGRPGPDYWQQRADYDITASLDTTTHTITGTVRLRYTNNSPEPLTYLWFQLDQNLFAEDSRGGQVSGRASRSLDASHGYRLGAVTVDGRAATPLVTDTRMRLSLPTPLAPGGGTTDVVIPYAFVIPGSPGTPRLGRLPTEYGTVYALAQWYPRVAVFDDVNGWNTMPYLGSGEFYLEYGDYELTLTVPASHTVVATGALLNEGDVYSREQRQRLDAARRSETALPIVTAADRDAAAGRSGTRTWRFRAENVRDVAWGTSAAFLLDGAHAGVRQADGRMNDVLILSAYPAEGIGTPDAPGWEEATRYGRASILNNSYWYPYPYPVAISVASHIGGMEYPMLHFSSVRSRHKGLFGVVDHELGHNWFPMIVGSDERRHAWMDEGFNTFINGPSEITFYNEGDDPSLPGYGEARPSTGNGIARSMERTLISVDDEILTYADQLDGREGGWNSYFKPGAGLHLLREAVLGRERFDAAFREYIQRWAYKHPQPADFFRTMEDASGEDLDWFWRGWFDTRHVYDATAAWVTQRDSIVTVAVHAIGGLVFPTVVEVSYTDGSTDRADVPVEGFGQSDEVTVSLDAGGRTVSSARIDPDELLPDVDRANDTAMLSE